MGLAGLFEVGFVAAADLGFRAQPAPADDATPIPTSAARLGSLGTTGVVVRMGIALRF